MIKFNIIIWVEIESKTGKTKMQNMVMENMEDDPGFSIVPYPLRTMCFFSLPIDGSLIPIMVPEVSILVSDSLMHTSILLQS